MKSLLGKGLLVLFSLLIAVVMLEIGLRLIKANNSGHIVRDDKIFQKYKPNIDGEYISESPEYVHVRTNEIGFSVSPEVGNPEVIVVNHGDSFTAGMEVDFDQKYAYLLAEKLTSQTGSTTQSHNFGVAGQGTGHALDTFKEYGVETNPDTVVLWYFLGNDFEDNLLFTEDSENEENTDPLWKELARKSELLVFTVNKLVRVPFVARLMDGTVLNRVGNDESGSESGLPITLRLMFTNDAENAASLENTRTYLSRLQSEVQSTGADLYVVLIPHTFQVSDKTLSDLFVQYPSLESSGFDDRRPNRELIAILEELNIPHLDPTEEFDSYCNSELNDNSEWCALYNCSACHLSERGHDLISNFASEFIASYSNGANNSESDDKEDIEENR